MCVWGGYLRCRGEKDLVPCQSQFNLLTQETQKKGFMLCIFKYGPLKSIKTRQEKTHFHSFMFSKYELTIHHFISCLSFPVALF